MTIRTREGAGGGPALRGSRRRSGHQREAPRGSRRWSGPKREAPRGSRRRSSPEREQEAVRPLEGAGGGPAPRGSKRRSDPEREQEAVQPPEGDKGDARRGRRAERQCSAPRGRPREGAGGGPATRGRWGRCRERKKSREAVSDPEREAPRGSRRRSGPEREQEAVQPPEGDGGDAGRGRIARRRCPTLRGRPREGVGGGPAPRGSRRRSGH